MKKVIHFRTTQIDSIRFENLFKSEALIIIITIV